MFVTDQITQAVALFDADFAQYADQENADAIRDSRHVQEFAEEFWHALDTAPEPRPQRRLRRCRLRDVTTRCPNCAGTLPRSSPTTAEWPAR